LDSWFLEDEMWKHLRRATNGDNEKKEKAGKISEKAGKRKNVRNSKRRRTTRTRRSTAMLSEPVIVKGLVSRGSLLQENLRKCNWKLALQAFHKTGGQYGNWCGKAPNGINDQPFVSYSACKGKTSKKGKWGLDVCTDSGLDEACSRHDQGAYTTDVFGMATKSLCKVDADFKEARAKMNITSTFHDGLSRSELNALTGANCLFDMMPCLRYERKAYWDWCQSWSGGYPCKKTKVGYFTYWPMGNYSKFKDDACGPPGCYSEP